MEMREIDLNAYRFAYSWGQIMGITQRVWFARSKDSPLVFFKTLHDAAEVLRQNGLTDITGQIENAKYQWNMRVGQKENEEMRVIYQTARRLGPTPQQSNIFGVLAEETLREIGGDEDRIKVSNDRTSFS